MLQIKQILIDACAYIIVFTWKICFSENKALLNSLPWEFNSFSTKHTKKSHYSQIQQHMSTEILISSHLNYNMSHQQILL